MCELSTFFGMAVDNGTVFLSRLMRTVWYLLGILEKKFPERKFEQAGDKLSMQREIDQSDKHRILQSRITILCTPEIDLRCFLLACRPTCPAWISRRESD